VSVRIGPCPSFRRPPRLTHPSHSSHSSHLAEIRATSARAELGRFSRGGRRARRDAPCHRRWRRYQDAAGALDAPIAWLSDGLVSETRNAGPCHLGGDAQH
jgi:hypothetical protein